MKRRNFYTYFILCFILILAVAALYVSCKSKSPTESVTALHNQVSVQSTNNTTTTTTKRPTTTSIGAPLLKWCSVTINGIPYANGSTYMIPPRSKKLTIGVFIKNRGTSPAQQVAANLYIEESSWDEGFKVFDGYEYLGTIPDDKKCYGSPSAFYMEINSIAADDWCWIHIIVNVPGCKSCSIDYYIYIDVLY